MVFDAVDRRFENYKGVQTQKMNDEIKSDAGANKRLM